MDKFVIIRGTKRNLSDCNNISESEPQPPKEDAIVSTPCASKTAKTMRAYKDILVYNPTWKNEYTWIDYDSSQMVWWIRFARSMVNHRYKREVMGGKTYKQLGEGEKFANTTREI